MNIDKKPVCPILDIDGVISGGKQFDLDITLPEDNRDVIYGVIKNCFKEPVCDAVVKLVEIVYDCGKEERRPIGHTFTDKEGEFVFGPLCPGKNYAIQIWVNDTKKVKICAKCHHEGKCLKGDQMDDCDCFLGKDSHEDKCDKDKCDNYKCDKCKCDNDKCDKDKFDKDKCDNDKCDKDKCQNDKCDKDKYDNDKCDKFKCVKYY